MPFTHAVRGFVAPVPGEPQTAQSKAVSKLVRGEDLTDVEKGLLARTPRVKDAGGIDNLDDAGRAALGKDVADASVKIRRLVAEGEVGAARAAATRQRDLANALHKKSRGGELTADQEKLLTEAGVSVDAAPEELAAQSAKLRKELPGKLDETRAMREAHKEDLGARNPDEWWQDQTDAARKNYGIGAGVLGGGAALLGGLKMMRRPSMMKQLAPFAPHMAVGGGGLLAYNALSGD